jgi:putative membrane protein
MADWNRGERLGLLTLALFTGFAVAGFATFGRNPGLLARFPELAGFYGPAFGFFAQGHILAAAGALACCLVSRVGGRWITAFVVVAAVSLTAELVGTSTGWPFGEYRYTELLGPRVAGLVPIVIPVSWFMMSLPAYGLSRGAGRGPGRWLLGALLLASWDLTLDPAMSTLSPYWVWESPGPLYGMPLKNLVGWILTGMVIMAALELCGTDAWLGRVPGSYLATYYGLVTFLSLAMVALSGMWVMVALALPALAWAAFTGWGGGLATAPRRGSALIEERAGS